VGGKAVVRNCNPRASNVSGSFVDGTDVETFTGASRRALQLEADARADYEVRAGREIADAEWAGICARLLEFAKILRGWERHPQRGKV
jgi:hypothetical protein